MKKILQAIILFVFLTSTFQNTNAEIIVSKASSSNDAQYVETSTGGPTIDGKAPFNAGGWSVYRVYYYDGSYGKGFSYNASVIEFDLSLIPSNAIIDQAVLNINVMKVIQQYNYDTKLAILTYLRSSGYTGNAINDYWHIDGPAPEATTLDYFYSGAFTGWKQIDVTTQIRNNIDEGINWAVFWISPAPWEHEIHVIGEAKGVSVAGADYNAGIAAPYLEINITTQYNYDFDKDGDVDGIDLYSFISEEKSLLSLNEFAAKFGTIDYNF